MLLQMVPPIHMAAPPPWIIVSLPQINVFQLTRLVLVLPGGDCAPQRRRELAKPMGLVAATVMNGFINPRVVPPPLGTALRGPHLLLCLGHQLN